MTLRFFVGIINMKKYFRVVEMFKKKEYNIKLHKYKIKILLTI